MGNDRQPNKLWLLSQFSLSVPKEIYRKSIKNIDTDASMKRVNYIPTDRYPWKEYFLNLWYSIVNNLI